MSANTLGRYQIIREIARSNDIVYEAVDPSINRRVALKELVLPPNLTGTQRRERIERFYREAKAAGSLSHPNIVTIYEVGEDNGRHFIAMEYLEGQSLRDVLAIEGSLSVDRTVEIIRQVCDALSYAHSNKVIHRDIKPDNIHILPGNRGVKITDFGIARLMEEPSITSDGQVFGTPSYMSPEQVAGKPLDPRTDIFSLGVTMYEMLTGRKPFTGDTVVTITYNILNQEPVIPPSIPPHIERVLRRCLAKNPDERYSSAAELAADLNLGVNGPAYQPSPSGDIGVTTSIPQPYYSQPPQPVQDPFAHLRSADMSSPRAPSRPLFSPETAYFLKVMLGVVAACGLVIGLVLLLSAGYRGWQKAGQEQAMAAHMRAGDQYFNSQSYQAAIEEYSKALRLATDPELAATARRNIAVAYAQLGIQADKSGDFSQAVAYFKQATLTDASFAEGYLLLGNSLRRMRRDDEAIEAWAKAIQSGGRGEVTTAARENIAIVYLERGDQAFQQNNLQLASDWWRKALEVAPGTTAGFAAQKRLDGVGG